MNLTGLYVSKRIIIYWHIFYSSVFHHICNSKCRLDCRYSRQNIFNAKNFSPHKKPISLLNVPICTQGMQRTWWPDAGTIIVTGLYYHTAYWLETLNRTLKSVASCLLMRANTGSKSATSWGNMRTITLKPRVWKGSIDLSEAVL